MFKLDGFCTRKRQHKIKFKPNQRPKVPCIAIIIILINKQLTCYAWKLEPEVNFLPAATETLLAGLSD